MNRKFWLAIAVIVVLTITAACWHLCSAPKVIAGTILVTGNGQESRVTLDALPIVPVAGQVVDGKGEMLDISAEGALLKDVLTLAGFDAEKMRKVTAVAYDGYRAEISGEELAESEKVWLLKEENGAALLVFGDENRKRNVENVIQLEAE